MMTKARVIATTTCGGGRALASRSARDSRSRRTRCADRQHLCAPPDVLIVVAQPIPARDDAGNGDDTPLNARLKAFGAAIPAVVEKRADAGRHILLVDMHTPFLSSRAPLLADQWHPNAAGYAIIGAQWFSVLKPLL